MQFLSGLDYIIFFLVLIITFLSVMYGQSLKNKLKKSEQDSALEILLMGRKLTLPLFVATLVSTWYGGIIGVTGLAYEKGIYNFITQGFFWYLSYLIFAFFLVKKIRDTHSLTLPDFISNIFGPKTRALSTILNFFNLLPLAYVISLGVFLQFFLGGSLWMSSLIGLIIVTIYSLWGGFRAVVFSDLIQFIVMFLAVIIVVIYSVTHYGSPLELVHKLPSTHFEILGGGNFKELIIWLILALATLVDPNFYQRCLAANSDTTARKGILISTGLWIVFDICTTLGALYARAALPGLDPSQSYINYSLMILPSGLRGLILAGILATILSTLDSYLVNCASTISFDLQKNKFKLSTHRLALLVVSFISFVASLAFSSNIVEVWKTLGGFSAACLLPTVILQLLKPKIISEKNFIISVSSSIIVMITGLLLNTLAAYKFEIFILGLSVNIILLSTLICYQSLRKKI